MKNHEKAKEFCEKEWYNEKNAKEDFIETISADIHRAPGNYTLNGLMKDLGTTFAYGEPKKAISVLEIIYEVLDKEKKFIETKQLDLKDKNNPSIEGNKLSNDELFDEAFNNMFKTAKQNDNDDLLKLLKELYLEQVQEPEVQPLGTGIGDV